MNMPLIAAIAPDCERVFMIRIAPKMMTRTSNALRKPVSVCPTALVPSVLKKGIFQTATPMITARIHARGRALFAGQLKPTIRTIVTTIGMNEIIAYISTPPQIGTVLSPPYGIYKLVPQIGTVLSPPYGIYKLVTLTL